VCGGWAIDLYLDEVTRAHEDLEVGVLRREQEALRSHLAGWSLFKCERAGAWDPWHEGERLELPVHQVLARPPGSGPPPEPWEPEADELQFFLNEVDGDVWICRRDPRVTKPFEEIVAGTSSGLPAVVPEVQLLYKAKHHLDKDELDFEATLGRLGTAQRVWLREALEIVHPGDPWFSRLEGPAADS
jgi:hypothetical protein